MEPGYNEAVRHNTREKTFIFSSATSTVFEALDVAQKFFGPQGPLGINANPL